jgi:hypothetical protein
VDEENVAGVVRPELLKDEILIRSMRNENGLQAKHPTIGSKGKNKYPSRAIIGAILKSQVFSTKNQPHSEIFFPIQHGVEIKNPPTQVGGKQFGWNKENLVPSASANAERL